MSRTIARSVLAPWLALTTAAIVLSACKSAQERCDEAQAAAHDAWSAYHAQVEGLHKAAITVQAEAHATISGPIQKRLSEAATKEADRLYDRSTSAWLRSYDASLQAACGEDKECFGLKQKNAEAKLRANELAPRVATAAAAASSATKARGEAEAAASAVKDDFERAEPLKAARLKSQAAGEACDGVK